MKKTIKGVINMKKTIKGVINMKKTIWSVTSLCSLTLLLIGCGNSATDSESSVDASSESREVVSTTTSETSVSDNEDIIYSTGPNGEKATSAYELSLTEEEKEKVREGNYTAAISFHYAGNDWSTSQQQGLTDTFEDLGIEIITVTDADFSVEQQVSDIENIISLDPDVLVSIPTDATSTADAYKRASEAGIEIVFMDNVPAGFTAGEEYISAVSADNYGNGVIAAELLGDSLNGEGEIGIVYFDADFFVTNQRLEGFKKTMSEEYPNIKIVSEQGFTDENSGAELADIILTQNPNIDGIFAHWDIPAEGVLSSIKASGSDVKLTTIDLGNNVALEIAQGNVVGLGAQMPYDQGVAEATLAAYGLLGKEAPEYVAVPAKKVNQTNILEAYEEVYKVEAPKWLKEAANN